MSLLKAVKLKEGEIVVMILRHFPLVYAPRVLAGLLLVSAPFFFMVPLFAMRGFGVPWGLFIFAASVLAGLLHSLKTFVVWYWNAFIITNLRVIDVDQRGFFERTVSEAAYDKVQDVSYKIKGFWGTLLNYGTLIIQTAGTTSNLELEYARDPKEVQHLLSEILAARLAVPAGARNEKVSALLEAAASLTDIEAKAFLVELKGAVNNKEPRSEAVDQADVEKLMKDDSAQD
ncbi:MAG: PH domain-containing protein [Patescibacteria group bacterium]|jgi:hypothetical protein